MERVDMTVFAVQRQMKFDQLKGELVERFPSIHKAERYGRIEFLLSPSASPFNSEVILGELHDKLKSFTNDDHLLLIGNPVLIGMAVSIASFYNSGQVRFLQWSGKHFEYTEIVVKIY